MPRLPSKTPSAILIRICAFLLVGWCSASAANTVNQLRARLGKVPPVYTSASQQFMAIGFEPGAPGGPPDRSMIRANHVQLDPAVLVANCERVRSYFMLLMRQQTDKWESTVTFRIVGRADPNMEIGVRGGRSSHGWRFTITVPGQVERKRLVRAIVRGILLDIANRGNNTLVVTEIPLWIQEGISARLCALWGDSITSSINHQVFGLDVNPRAMELQGAKVVAHRAPNSVVDQTYRDLLGPERRHLDLFQPLGFTDLQHPLPGHLVGSRWRTFQACSHVFMAQLLDLNEGEKKLWKTIEALPRYRNAQFAFLEAFKTEFASALAADQWWSVVLVDFKTRDPSMRWDEKRSLARLKDILYTPVTIRTSSNSVPVVKEMIFQQLIRETPFEQHRAIITPAIAKLVIMQLNARADLAKLIRDYRETLANYLQRNNGRIDSSAAKLLKKNTIEQLDLLDGIRFDMKLVASPEPEREFSLNRVERMLNDAIENRGASGSEKK
ncbi:MAG: hypothetical protein ACPGVU_17845 [Limisphaerales bacterium]